ncbi:MAG: hypothetical protein AABZ34_19530 [Nitrospirota bacterium]
MARPIGLRLRTIVAGQILNNLEWIYPVAGVVLPGSQEVENIGIDLFRFRRQLPSGLSQ